MIKVIDNFFNNPDLIRNYAMTINYKSPSEEDFWKGFRSNELSINNIMEKNIIEKIKLKLLQIYNQKDNLLVYFHQSPKCIMDEVKNFHEYKYHKDYCNYAGVIYLTPNPPKNTGTCFKNMDCIENVYNRFLCYPGKLIHGPDNLFGKDLKSNRMTITFFSLN